MKTTREVPFAKTAMQSFTNLRFKDQKEDVRKMLGIKISEINNYLPSDVVSQLNTVLTSSNLNHTFFDLIENGVKLNPQGHTFGYTKLFFCRGLWSLNLQSKGLIFLKPFTLQI